MKRSRSSRGARRALNGDDQGAPSAPAHALAVGGERSPPLLGGGPGVSARVDDSPQDVPEAGDGRGTWSPEVGTAAIGQPGTRAARALPRGCFG